MGSPVSESIDHDRVFGGATPCVVGEWGEIYTDPDTGKTRSRLTDAGKLALAAYLVDYPHPVALLTTAWPWMVHECRRSRMTEDDIDSACLEGMVRGFIRHQEGRGAALSTSLAWAIRGAVAHAISRQAKYRELLMSHEWNGKETDYGALEPYAPEKPHVEDGHLLGMLKRTRLLDRDCVILAARVKGTPNPELARELGISTSRVQQLSEKVLARIRKANNVPTPAKRQRKPMGRAA